MRKPKMIFYYRGQIERWVAAHRQYEWFNGYSEGIDGKVSYPWQTRSECQRAAKEAGTIAKFVELGEYIIN